MRNALGRIALTILFVTATAFNVLLAFLILAVAFTS